MNADFVGEGLAVLPIGGILWVVAILAAVLFLVHALILSWHWREYSTGAYTSAANMLVYLGIGSCFLALLFFSALWYSLA